MRSLYESILDSDEQVTQNIKSAIIVHKIKKNLELCNDISEFCKLWTTLGLNLPHCIWGELTGKGNYTDYNDDFCVLILCQKNMIVIYNDSPGMWKDHKTFKEYSEKVAKTLKMNMELNKLSYGEEYVLTFK